MYALFVLYLLGAQPMHKHINTYSLYSSTYFVICSFRSAPHYLLFGSSYSHTQQTDCKVIDSVHSFCLEGLVMEEWTWSCSTFNIDGIMELPDVQNRGPF